MLTLGLTTQLTMVHTPGTEDEYGSCWGFGAAFSRPYCGYLSDGKGSNRMYRWYLANPVRFQKSLHVEIQDICDFGPGRRRPHQHGLLVPRRATPRLGSAAVCGTHGPQ